MITVTYRGIAYICHKAFKGTNYIHLVDENDCMIVAFNGISDFSAFAITGGDWMTPVADDECYVAVVREDGSVGKGGHRCSDIGTVARYQISLSASSDAWVPFGESYIKTFTVEGIEPSDLVVLHPATEETWAKAYVQVDIETDSITVRTNVLPSTDCTLYMYLIRVPKTTILS